MAFTVNDIKKLSPQAKALIVIVLVLVVGYLYYVYFLSDALTKKATLEKDYQDIQLQIQQKEKIVTKFDEYKAKVATLEEEYKVALLKLPDQREIPGLFHSVAMAGKDADVEFVLFEPRAAVPKTFEKPAAEKPGAGSLLKPTDQKAAESSKAVTEPAKAEAESPKPDKGKKGPAPEPFYEEIPVKVTVSGSFQNIVHFFEKVARLPRIVNISDISMVDRKEVKGRGFVITTTLYGKDVHVCGKKRKNK